jgi:hypothetical protein
MTGLEARARVDMGSVWDRTVEVINGRAAMLVSIAALTLWLPAVLRQAVAVVTIGTTADAAAPGSGALGLLFVLSIAAAVLAILGQLALIAVASDPATTRGEALAIAARRLPLAIGVALLLALAVFVALIPAVAPIASTLPSPAVITPVTLKTAMEGIAPGTRGFISLYLLAFVVAMVWLTARLALLNPVIVNQREGVHSLARSFALTRGLTWKIVGLFVLFAIVVMVVTLATQSVVGIVFRLLLGANNAGATALLVAAANAILTCAVTITWTAFLAQLYVAVRATSPRE